MNLLSDQPENYRIAREITKVLTKTMYDHYSEGAFVKHLCDNDKDEPYTSWPDSEVVLGPINAIQDDIRLNEFLMRFKDRAYEIPPNTRVKLNGGRISHPHNIQGVISVPPHPSMSDEELLKYMWPNAKLATSYNGILWLDLPSSSATFEPDTEDEFGSIITNAETVPSWYACIDWPIMVGSNKCNMNVIRSYINDQRELVYEDSQGNQITTTYDARARYILTDLTQCELNIPDGYFIINGVMKKANTMDRLLMNTPRVIQLKKSRVIGSTICEILSLHAGSGFFAQHHVYLAGSSTPGKKGSRNNNSEVREVYNGILSFVPNIKETSPYNIMEFARNYILFMTSPEEIEERGFRVVEREASNTLPQIITTLSQGDSEMQRVVYMALQRMPNIESHEEAIKSITDMFTKKPEVKNKHKRPEDPEEEAKKPKKEYTAPEREEENIYDVVRRKFLPNCTSVDAKLRMLGMMGILTILVLTGKMDYADLKAAADKRWQTLGSRLEDHIRVLLQSKTTIIDQYHRGTLLTTMAQDKWPNSAEINKRGKSSDENLAAAVIGSSVVFNNVSILDGIRGIKITASSSGNTNATRKVHGSQMYYQCPANTPEGANIGLNNNFAEANLCTVPLTDDELETLYSYFEDTEFGDVILMVDGNPIKYVSKDLFFELRSARRAGDLSGMIGLTLSRYWVGGPKVLNVRTAPGRPTYPALIIDRKVDAVDRIQNSLNMSFQEMLTSGIAEYLDGHESSYNCNVAPWIKYVIEEPGVYTHSVLAPQFLLSQTTNCLQFINHNPPARGTYASQHIRQSLGRPFTYEENRFDHEIATLDNPEPSLISTETARRIGVAAQSPYVPIPSAHHGIARSVVVAHMCNHGNVDDGIHFSSKLVDDGILDGTYFDIFKSNANISTTGSGLKYNVQLKKESPDSQFYVEIRDPKTGDGLVDPNFSDGVIVPYGDPYLEEVSYLPQPIELFSLLGLKAKSKRPIHLTVYSLPNKPGTLWIKYGYNATTIVSYRDNKTGQEFTREIDVSKDAIRLPDATYLGSKRGNGKYKLALAYVREDVMNNYETEFLDDVPAFTSGVANSSKRNTWYGPKRVSVPRLTKQSMNVGRTSVIMRRRWVVHGDVATIALKMDSKTHKILLVDKEYFSVAKGHIYSIQRGSIVKIKVGMPIGPKVGNKYAALYAQKSICSLIIPRNQVPVIKIVNPQTGLEEEVEVDIIFNPLGFISRMTAGYLIEGYFGHTLKMLYDRVGTWDPETLNTFGLNNYGIQDLADVVTYLRDCTAFQYDMEHKRSVVDKLRQQMELVHGIPADGLFNMYSYNELTGKRDIPINNRIAVGYMYYVALRHLVDNKNRSRGYVGKKEPFSRQPVKGKRRNGGQVTGEMESAAYRAHGARAMGHERMAKASDATTLYKCNDCGGLVAKNGNEYLCMDEGRIPKPKNSVFQCNSVISWEIYKYFTKGMKMEIIEEYE